MVHPVQIGEEDDTKVLRGFIGDSSGVPRVDLYGESDDSLPLGLIRELTKVALPSEAFC